MNNPALAGSLLEKTTPTKLGAIASFRLADYLKLGTMIGKCRVTYVGPNFLKHFGEVEEKDIPATELKAYTLREWALDTQITNALGIGAEENPPLAHMIEVLKLGAHGPGYFNGEANLHYKRSPIDGRIYTPHWYMRGDRLGFGALPFDDSVGWEIGDRFFRA